MRKGFEGYKLTSKYRDSLLDLFPPSFPDVIADHVTYRFGVSEDDLTGPETATFQLLGMSSDDSLEAMVVAMVNGDNKVEVRPDGRRFHITWSLDRSKGRKPVQSNDVIASRSSKFTPVDMKLMFRAPRYFSE